MSNKKTLYHLIDGRGGMLAASIETADLNKVDPNWERFILLTSESAKEICHHATIDDYGKSCVVAKNNIIMWDWCKMKKDNLFWREKSEK